MLLKIAEAKKRALLIALSIITLTACQSTASDPLIVGPVAPSNQELKQQQAKVQSLKQSEVFLDVAVPTFDPGFPTTSNGEIDYEEMNEEGVWPQLRRTEAKLFSVETKNALEKTGAFGSVRVVPDTNTTADVFVLGKILYSDSEEVEMELTVVDASGEILGKKAFSHTVSESYIKDLNNAGKNSYQPIFDRGRDYVIQLLSELDDEEKQSIKNVALLRYARYYNPDEYSQYLNTEIERKRGQRYYKFNLTGMPAENDPSLTRIEDLRAQELLFVDRMQDQYDAFYAETQDAYYQWQRETLPEIIARRDAQTNRNIKAGLGIGLAVLAGILLSKSRDRSSDEEESRSRRSTERGAQEAGAILAGVGSAIAINDAFKSNSEMKVQSAIIEEKGQAVDLTVGPTEMKFADQIIELKGTATEQYLQWKRHLREMYELEKTPDVQL